MQNQLQTNNPHYLAKIDKQIVGWCDIRRETTPSMAHCGTLGMGVIEGFREQGIGEALIRTTVEHAKVVGIERIELTVIATNQRAYHLYHKLGFTDEGIKRRSVKLRGKYLDRIMMALDLANTPHLGLNLS